MKAFVVGLLFVAAFIWLPTPSLRAQSGLHVPTYVRSAAGAPWNSSANEAAMDRVFGVGTWQDLRYETIDAATLLSSSTFIFMEGSDTGAQGLEDFLTANIAAIQDWVNAGGILFVNAAPNEGGGMSFGFGIGLNYPDFTASAAAAAPGHSIFNGPFDPAAMAWSGTEFAHASVSGARLIPLITNSANGRIVLGEMPYGLGQVLFGGMTTDDFDLPQPEAANLRASILAYANDLLDQSTNQPPTILTQPASQTVEAGASLSLDVAVLGTRPLTLQWQLNGENLPGATNSALSLVNVTTNDAGNYDVVVSNALDSVTSQSAALTVNMFAPSLTNQPVSETVLAGGAMKFSVGANGAPPPIYQWQFEGVALPGATNADLFLFSVTTSQAGSYSVVVSNQLGQVTSQPAVLTVVGLPADANFRITSLSADHSQVADQGVLTGNDRGGIAVSSSQVFCTGDAQTARFALADLSGGTGLGIQYDALTSNLRTEKVYSLGNGTTPIPAGGGTVTTLIELDGQTGQLTTNILSLSRPITLGSGSGIFAGYDQVVLHNGTRVYAVLLSSGVVVDLGEMSMPQHQVCASWAFWGVAEYFDGAVHLVYVRDPARIVRTGVPDRQTETVAAFTNLSDTCSITLSLSLNRWYFHQQKSSQFSGTAETLGYADAAWEVPVSVIISAPSYSASIVFTDALANTTMPIAFDGISYWSASGGGYDGTHYARYDAAGAPVATYSPGRDFRSVFSDPTGAIFARQYDDRSIYRQTDPGVFVKSGIVLTGGRLDSQSAVTLNAAATEYIAMVDGIVSRWDTNGAFIASTTLSGFHEISTENDFPQYRGIVAIDAFWLTYNGHGILSAWNANGRRIGRTTLLDAGASFDSAFSLSFANGKVFVVDNEAGAWRGYDLAVRPRPPLIIVQPTSQTLLAGASVTFRVTAYGYPLSYQWQFDGANLPGATNSILTLRNVLPENAGSYTVVLSNALDPVISQAAELTVTAVAPVITLQPVSQTVPAGASVTFAVAATGAPPPTYQWQKDGVDIQGATSAAFTLANTRATDGGSYAAVVSNVSGSVTSAMALLTVSPGAFRLDALAPLPDGSVPLALIGEPGRQYLIEVSTNLTLWSVLTNFTSVGVTNLIEDAGAAAHPRRFYRARAAAP